MRCGGEGTKRNGREMSPSEKVSWNIPLEVICFSSATLEELLHST